jgi:hypothetical protein
MCRTAGVLLVLLLALPAPAEGDKPQDKPKAPEEQYKALVKEYSDAMKAFQEAYRSAEGSEEEQEKVVREKYPQAARLAPRFLELAEKNPTDPVAFDALAWVVSNVSAGAAEKDSPRARATAQLARDYVRNDKIGGVCQRLASGYDKEGEGLLRAVLDKNSNPGAKAEACLALAERLGSAAELARRLKDKPDMVGPYEGAYGKECIEELRKADTAKVEAESAAFFKDFADKYASEMKPDRLVQICVNLGFSGRAGGEPLLRALLEKDTRRDVQGVACLGLAQSLKARADRLPESRAEEAAKLRKESEEAFDRAGEKYADVKLPFRGTVGEKAKGELFELRFLTVGKVAPDVEGEDFDGKTFKLSEYRGKVVLLDFWGNW